jgi:hypothetical protein
LAIALHKGFAAFSLGCSIRQSALSRNVRRALPSLHYCNIMQVRIALASAFVAATPIGVGAGWGLSASLSGPWNAVLQAVASGSLWAPLHFAFLARQVRGFSPIPRASACTSMILSTLAAGLHHAPSAHSSRRFHVGVHDIVEPCMHSQVFTPSPLSAAALVQRSRWLWRHVLQAIRSRALKFCLVVAGYVGMASLAYWV